MIHFPRRPQVLHGNGLALSRFINACRSSQNYAVAKLKSHCSISPMVRPRNAQPIAALRDRQLSAEGDIRLRRNAPIHSSGIKHCWDGRV